MSDRRLGERFHALDCLRGFAMLLGVLLHAAISFMVSVPPFWPVRDEDPSPVLDVFLLAVHDFRMQLFFFLAGFFGCLLSERYGLWGLAKHRVRRVVVPFLLGLFLICPTAIAVILFAEIENVRVGGVRGPTWEGREFAADLVAKNPDSSSERLVLDSFLTGRWFTPPPLVHLWFLYFLIQFYAVVVILGPIVQGLARRGWIAPLDTAFRWVVRGWGRIAIPTLATTPWMFTMQGIVDTPSNWQPMWHLLGYYFGFFLFGWMLFRHRDLIEDFGRGWNRNLLLANAVVLPILVGLALEGVATPGKFGPDTLEWIAWCIASAWYTWLMITGLWGGFLRYLNHDRVWVRYLADASYWCYLASITPIVLLQWWVRDWPIPGLVKFGFVSVFSILGLLASYECCVRYTVIGAILHGRKTRPTTPTSPPAEPAARERDLQATEPTR